jgi:two-component system cell cycle sensor histidine kinase/response regulator CckA
MKSLTAEPPASHTRAADFDELSLGAAQVRQLYSQVQPGVYGALVAGAILVTALWKVIPHWKLIIWLASYSSVQLPRIWLISAFGKFSATDSAAIQWGKWWILFSALSALLLGLLPIFVFPADSLMHQFLLALFLVAASSVMTTTHAPVTEAYLPTILLPLLPLSGRFFLESGEVNMVLGVLTMVFAGILVATGRHMHMVTKNSLTLRFENSALIQSLKRAQDELEMKVRDRTAELRSANERLVLEIEDRARAEKAHRNSEQMLSHILATSPVGTAYFEDGKLKWANNAMIKMFGHANEDEYIGRAAADFYASKQEYKRVQSLLYGSLERGGTAEAEARFKRNDGELFHGLIKTSVPGPGGPRTGTITTIVDISERKESEQQLSLSEERYRTLVEESFDGIFVQKGTKIVFANTRLHEMLGYQKGELEGQDHWEVYHPDYQTITRERAQARMRGEQVPSQYEVRLQRKDGSAIDGEINAKAVEFGGEPGVQVWVRDITERKAAEEELRKSERKYRKILETIIEGYHEVDLAGNLTLVNDSLCSLAGYSREELLGLNYSKLMDKSNANEAFRVYNEVFRTGAANPACELEITRKDGTKATVLASVSLIRDSEGRPAGFRGMFRDITEYKRLEEQLRQAAKMEAIGHLAGGIAHDFNNLLTAMMGYTNILMQQLPEQGGHQRKLAQVNRAAERAAVLTHQLLAFSRKQLLDMRVMDLNEVITDFEIMLRRLIGENIEIVTALDPAIGTVKGDRGQVEQILMNLTINARDAMPNGGRLVIETANAVLGEEYALAHPEVRPGDYVMMAASDTGHGMDADTLSRIFDPFFTTKQKGIGTGLGLSTVYGIVKQHDGHVAVYSEPGQGTTFKIYLPRVQGEARRSPKKLSTQPAPRGNETILVVEDEEMLRNLACEALDMLGYSTIVASDAEEAIALCKKHEGPIELLLTDVVLPKMDGRTLYGELSKECPNMRVLYVSGYAENFIVRHGVLDPDVHFLQKPFSLDALGHRVREVLDS